MIRHLTELSSGNYFVSPSTIDINDTPFDILLIPHHALKKKKEKYKQKKGKRERKRKEKLKNLSQKVTTRLPKHHVPTVIQFGSQHAQQQRALHPKGNRDGGSI